MLKLKKSFTLKKSELSNKFRVENNSLDLSSFIDSTGYDVRKIGDVATAHRNDRKKKETADSVFKYVQISNIDVELGRIKSFRKCIGSSAPNNARRIMRHGDILVSTRRPTRGAVVAVPEEFDGDICTVFFTTLTVNDWDVVDPWYLALFLRTSIGRFQFSSMITETAYPVISDADVTEMTLLLPDIDEQRRVAAKYEEAVGSFFGKLNSAYQEIIDAKQEIEALVLKDFAEVLEHKRFGLDVEEIVDDNGED